VPLVKIPQCTAAMWTQPSGIEMEMIVGAEWTHRIENEGTRQD